jgi:hypothetical protein
MWGDQSNPSPYYLLIQVLNWLPHFMFAFFSHSPESDDRWAC